MKRIITLATLLMVSCGGNHSEQKPTEETPTPAAKPQFADDKMSSKKEMIMPQSAPISIEAVTADKDARYINNKNLSVAIKE